jgi:hypothetical protein
MALEGFYDLEPHVGHKIKAIQYGDDNVVLMCRTCDETLLDFDRDEDAAVKYARRGRYETRPLYATVDDDGDVVDIYSEESEAVEAPENDYVQGYGVFNIRTNLIPDEAQDFHHSFETAKEELELFATRAAENAAEADDEDDDAEDDEGLDDIGLTIPPANPGPLGVIVTRNEDDDDDY